jgi:predicted ATPase
VRKPEAELRSALDRLIAAGLLFRQGVPPHAMYPFNHALVRDAAYGTLLREPRLALHASIAEAIESRFAEIAESQPELLAHHCTEAGLIDKAISLWGKAGHRSLDRSALAEAAEQLTRALDQIAAVAATPLLRRKQIELQVALINPLMHVKGYGAPETKRAEERARQLIEQAEALGEPPEDPLLLFSVLYGVWVAKQSTFNGDVLRELAAEFLALAEKQAATVPLMVGHRLLGTSLLMTGDIADSLPHYDRAIALYDAAEHRPLVTRFGQDLQLSALCYRSLSFWALGYPDAALLDASQALKHTRDIGQAATLMFTLHLTALTHVFCGNYELATAQCNEFIVLANEKDALLRKAQAMSHKGCVLALMGQASDAIHTITCGIAAIQAMEATIWMPFYLPCLARAHAELGQFDHAWQRIAEARTMVETTKERWCEADLYRVAGELALMSPQADAAKAEAHFERALGIAREQQAKSWELRAAMSMARLWHGQGKRPLAHDLLAPVYGWFTEGFDTVDLKEAKSLLEQLKA